MKKLILILLVVLVPAFFAVSGVAQQKKRALGYGYQPQVQYQGEYKSNLIFFRYTQNDTWRRQPHMDSLQSITCQYALDRLNTDGKWQGRLKSDGSCGNNNEESPEWATGNRINYDTGSGQSVN
jgi:hypothetical protein